MGRARSRLDGGGSSRPVARFEARSQRWLAAFGGGSRARLWCRACRCKPSLGRRLWWRQRGERPRGGVPCGGALRGVGCPLTPPRSPPTAPRCGSSLRRGHTHACCLCAASPSCGGCRWGSRPPGAVALAVNRSSPARAPPALLRLAGGGAGACPRGGAWRRPPRAGFLPLPSPAGGAEFKRCRFALDKRFAACYAVHGVTEVTIAH